MNPALRFLAELKRRRVFRVAAVYGAAAFEAERAPAWDLAGLYATFGDSERAIRLLQRAFDEGDPQLIMTAADSTFDPRRGDPRFTRILHALRLPAEAVR